ncbi:Bro-N domain-containing protein [Butyribacter intestini]|jgi:prophage antirepressor-like protein|uniref:BRO-N domain-containing protein n=1 Tax=Butyribacter intestini TaxID=1703332 RepID=UPI003AB3E0F9
MSTYTTNTKPESKFEDVPEEVLTDPTMRTALGMDPIPGMNTPVDDKQISMFDYMQNKNNSSTSSSTTTTAAPEVTVFKNLVHPEFGELRTVEIDGEPWFVGKDVAAALGYTNSRDAIATHVFADDKGVESIDTLGGRQKMTIINESGLYALVFGSRLKIAKDFKHWVTSEVLPSIRKNGAYIRNQENMTPAEIVARGLIAAQKIIEEREKEIVHLNNRCGRLTQTIAEKQDVINAISRNVPAPTKRMMLNRVMRRRSPELAQSRWSYLYARFDEIYHKNVKIRMKNYNAEPGHRKCYSILDFIEKVLNMLDELYDLAVKLFESDFTQLMQEMHLLRMTDEEYEDEEYWKRVL